MTLKFQTEVFDCNCPAKCIEACETEVLYGGAMMVRRDVIEQVGKMPEVFFLFAEEFDWSYQITEAGYKLWYEAEVVVYHKGGATIGYGSPNRAYYMSRARLLFTRRRSKWAIRLLSCTYLVLLVRIKQHLKPIKIAFDNWRFNREAEKHVGVHYECPFCGFHSDDLALLGIDSPAARKYKTVGMGVRPGMCWKCRANEYCISLQRILLLNVF